MGESVNNGTSVIEDWLMGDLYSECITGNIYLRVTWGLLVSGNARGGCVSLSGVQGL